MALTKTQIALIQNYFKTQPVLKAYIFGSYARNQSDSESDIDILVDLDYSKKIGLEFIQMKIDLENLLEYPIDLVSSRGLSKHIEPFIESEKQLLYEK